MKLPTRLLSLCFATACAMLASCSSAPRSFISGDSYLLTIEGEMVSVSCQSPMPISEFLKMAQVITNGMYTFRKDEVDGEVSWVGKITCDRNEFDQFVQTMLATKGLALEARQQGDIEVLEVRAIKRS